MRARLLNLVWIIVLISAVTAAVASPFAASVVDYSHGDGQWVENPMFNDPVRALGRPYGLTASYADNRSVVTLGDGGSITLAFDHDVMDDPANPGGYDFIVFSNALFVDGDPTFRWQEPAFVEISRDGQTWYLILPNILPSSLIGGVDTGPSETVLRGYAEYTPTLGLPTQPRTAEEFYTTPDRQSIEGDMASLNIDTISGGGDAFDIADAVLQSAPGVPMLDGQGSPIPAGINSFRYIRLTDALVGDKVGNLGEVSAEIDAVSDISPNVSVGTARQLLPGTYVIIWGAKVTAVFTDEIWIEQPDRSAGLCVLSDAVVSEGDKLAVTGHIVDTGADVAITHALVTVLESGDRPSPPGLSNKSAAAVIAPGLLVKVWGRRTDAGDGWYRIDDGSGAPIKVLYTEGETVPAEGEFVLKVGVLTRDADGSVLRPTE